MTVENKIIPQPFGEVNERDIQAANMVAKAVLQASGPRSEVEFLLPDGEKIKGFSFTASDGRKIIVTSWFIATEEGGKIEQFFPRK